MKSCAARVSFPSGTRRCRYGAGFGEDEAFCKLHADEPADEPFIELVERPISEETPTCQAEITRPRTRPTKQGFVSAYCGNQALYGPKHRTFCYRHRNNPPKPVRWWIISGADVIALRNVLDRNNLTLSRRLFEAALRPTEMSKE